MSLYDGVGLDEKSENDASLDSSKIAGWSSNLQFMKTQLQLKKASKGGPPPPRTKSSITSSGPGSLTLAHLTGSIDPKSIFLDEYDPLRPNEYEEWKNKLRAKEREEKREKERKEKEIERREKDRAQRDRDRETQRDRGDRGDRDRGDRDRGDRDRDRGDRGDRGEREFERDRHSRRNKDENEDPRRHNNRDNDRDFERDRRRRDGRRREEEDDLRQRQTKLFPANNPPNRGGAAIAPPPSLLDAPPLLGGDSNQKAGAGTGGFSTGNVVASNIMAKYGWKEGQGLGKDEQGLSTCLQVEKTSRRGGKIINKDITTTQPETGSTENPQENSILLKNPSKVIILKNMVGPGEVDDDLQSEVEEECNQKYGEVIKALIFEIPGAAEEEAVRIFVEFRRMESAMKAIVDLNGRYFGGRIVTAGFYNLDKFRRLDLAS